MYKFPEGASLDLKLRPPLKIPKKSKKIYRDLLFIRTLDKGTTHHIYTLGRLYVCSHYMKPIDEVYEWINKNHETIANRAEIQLQSTLF